jgi:outer membrane protein, heavy metal efflux system
MKPTLLSTTLLAFLLAFLLAAPACLYAQASEGGRTLALTELLEAVAASNPTVRAAGARAEAGAARVPEASTLPDPVLQIGVMNVGLPEFDAGMPNSMAPSVQLMQSLPFPGKLGLRGEIAEAGWAMDVAGADETWWDVRERAASLFYELYALDRQLDVMRETLGLLRDFRTIARALYAAGEGRQADVLRADVEVARMDGDIRMLEARRTAARARLNGLLDRPSQAALPPPTLEPLPAVVPESDTLGVWARESRPLLARARLGVYRAEAGAALARRQIWPDLMVGLTYGQRRGDMGTERMGSATVGFSLPVHAGRRQLALRDEAEALARAAAADADGRTAEVDARIGVLLAELERARSLLVLFRREILPGARATVESARSSYRVGAVDFMTLVDAQMTSNRYQSEFHLLVADYGRAVAGLESTVGRPLPRTDEILVVDPETR